MRMCWVTIRVKDMKASQRFYEDFLGLEFERSFSPEDGMTIAFYTDKKGMEIELIHDEKDRERSVSCPVTIGIKTNKFYHLLRRAEELKIRITNGPVALSPDCYCFFAEDPDGVGIQIIKAQPEEPLDVEE